jgi:hypothetical protein
MIGRDAGVLRDEGMTAWVEALEKRYLGDITFQEARRALEALSAIYTQKRDRLAKGAALEGRGKRAAFAFFYGPLHFMLVQKIVLELGLSELPLDHIVDVGCGTGVGGAAWSSLTSSRARVTGVDVDPWAIAEARWTYGYFGLSAQTNKGTADATRFPDGSGVIAAYTVNELDDAARGRLLKSLLDAKKRGCRALIVEPIAKTTSPWWPEWVSAIKDAGGRDDEWNFPAELPSRLRLMDKAAGLRHDRLKGRTLCL